MKKLLPILFILLLLSAAYPKTVSLSDYATPGDGLDDSAGLQEAIGDITATGGTVFVPGGIWDFSDEVYLNNSSNVSYKIQGDKGAVLRLNLGQSKRLFRAGNLNQFDLQDLIFIGLSDNIYDAEFIATVSYTQQFSVVGCQFFGFRFKQAAFFTSNTDAVYDNVQFEGGVGDTAVIHAADYRSVTVRNALFVDYGNFRGVYYSKLALGNPLWIKIEGGAVSANANSQQRVNLSNIRFDEGALAAVSIKNTSYADISGILVNVSGGEGGVGIILDDVEYAEVSMSKFGMPQNARPAIIAKNRTTFKAKALTFGESVYFADVDETSEAVTESCAGCLNKNFIKRR